MVGAHTAPEREAADPTSFPARMGRAEKRFRRTEKSATPEMPGGNAKADSTCSSNGPGVPHDVRSGKQPAVDADRLLSPQAANGMSAAFDRGWEQAPPATQWRQRESFRISSGKKHAIYCSLAVAFGALGVFAGRWSVADAPRGPGKTGVTNARSIGVEVAGAGGLAGAAEILLIDQAMAAQSRGDYDEAGKMFQRLLAGSAPGCGHGNGAGDPEFAKR